MERFVVKTPHPAGYQVHAYMHLDRKGRVAWEFWNRPHAKAFGLKLRVFMSEARAEKAIARHRARLKGLGAIPNMTMQVVPLPRS